VEPLHDRAARRPDVEGEESVEQHLRRLGVTLQPDVVEVQGRLGPIPHDEDETGDGVAPERPARS